MQHPLVIVGAGPAGLAAAAHAHAAASPPSSSRPATRPAPRSSSGATSGCSRPGPSSIDPVGREAARPRAAGPAPTPASYPTGREWVERYLAPLADAARRAAGVEVRYGHRVAGVARAGRDRLVAIGRDEVPLQPSTSRPPRAASGSPAARVIDASGTWGTAPTRSAPTATPPTARPSTPTGSSTASPTSPTRRSRRGTPASTSPSPARGASAQNALVGLAQLADAAPRAPG